MKKVILNILAMILRMALRAAKPVWLATVEKVREIDKQYDHREEKHLLATRWLAESFPEVPYAYREKLIQAAVLWVRLSWLQFLEDHVQTK